jgi:hypothetical protein
MAPPPGKKPEAKKVTDADAAGKIIGILVILAIIGTLATWLGNIVDATNGELSAVDAFMRAFSRTGILNALYRFAYGPYLWFSIVVTIAFGAGAFYSFLGLKKARQAKKEEIRMFEAKLTADASGSRNERWERILSQISSDNPGDWRAAIIDADIALQELVQSMGYHGDTLGDMLKAVEKSDFQTLDLAWEAHKIRNRIAHHGSDFILTEREAKRVIGLYREVFQEFDVI